MNNSQEARLKHQHETIRMMTGNHEDERLTRQLMPGKWTIKDNIAHLAKYQPVFLNRIDLILNKTTPVFGRYRAENDPEFETWRQYTPDELLTSIDNTRSEIFNKICKLTDAELSRTGIHNKYGTLTIPGWTEFFLLHEAHHIFTIFQLMHDTELYDQ